MHVRFPHKLGHALLYVCEIDCCNLSQMRFFYFAPGNTSSAYRRSQGWLVVSRVVASSTLFSEKLRVAIEQHAPSGARGEEGKG